MARLTLIPPPPGSVRGAPQRSGVDHQIGHAVHVSFRIDERPDGANRFHTVQVYARRNDLFSDGDNYYLTYTGTDDGGRRANAGIMFDQLKQDHYCIDEIPDFGALLPKSHEAGVPVADLCRKHGFSDAAFYGWRAKFGGLQVSEAKRLRELEAENAKLKKLLAETMLDKEALRIVARGKF